MPGTEELASKALEELHLAPAGDKLFIGKVSGFPVGLKCFANESSAVFLFQIRYPDAGQPAAEARKNLGEKLNCLIKEKRIEVEIEDNIAWLELSEGEKL